MDVLKLLKALDDEDNNHLLELTHKKITQIKTDILKELQLPRAVMVDFLKKLKEYRYVDEMNEMKYGYFIRWITISDPQNITLSKSSAIFCDLKVTDDGVFVVYKNFNQRYYQFKMEECLIFQKISDQEHVLLSALDHIQVN